MPPHFSIAVDKSTPHRDTNHAIMVIVPMSGVRMAIPIDAPLVYDLDEEGDLHGGCGVDLANQVADILTERLDLNESDFHFIRSMFILHFFL